MIVSFLRGFVLTALATALVLVGLGAAAAALLFREPAARHEARGMSFTVPAGWRCGSEGTETICEPLPGNPLAKRAIIVATAKTVSANDNAEFYEAYLTTPHRPFNSDTDSTILYYRESEIGGRQWADALHQGSLLPTYYSRYLAVVVGATAVLITLSFHKDVYAEQDAFMTEFVSSIRVRGELGTAA